MIISLRLPYLVRRVIWRSKLWGCPCLWWVRSSRSHGLSRHEVSSNLPLSTSWISSLHSLSHTQPFSYFLRCKRLCCCPQPTMTWSGYGIRVCLQPRIPKVCAEVGYVVDNDIWKSKSSIEIFEYTPSSSPIWVAAISARVDFISYCQLK